jgi:hypothetical protein
MILPDVAGQFRGVRLRARGGGTPVSGSSDHPRFASAAFAFPGRTVFCSNDHEAALIDSPLRAATAGCDRTRGAPPTIVTHRCLRQFGHPARRLGPLSAILPGRSRIIRNELNGEEDDQAGVPPYSGPINSFELFFSLGPPGLIHSNVEACPGNCCSMRFAMGLNQRSKRVAKCRLLRKAELSRHTRS